VVVEAAPNNEPVVVAPNIKLVDVVAAEKGDSEVAAAPNNRELELLVAIAAVVAEVLRASNGEPELVVAVVLEMIGAPCGKLVLVVSEVVVGAPISNTELLACVWNAELLLVLVVLLVARSTALEVVVRAEANKPLAVVLTNSSPKVVVFGTTVEAEVRGAVPKVELPPNLRSTDPVVGGRPPKDGDVTVGKEPVALNKALAVVETNGSPKVDVFGTIVTFDDRGAVPKFESSPNLVVTEVEVPPKTFVAGMTLSDVLLPSRVEVKVPLLEMITVVSETLLISEAMMAVSLNINSLFLFLNLNDIKQQILNFKVKQQ